MTGAERKATNAAIKEYLLKEQRRTDAIHARDEPREILGRQAFVGEWGTNYTMDCYAPYHTVIPHNRFPIKQLCSRWFRLTEVDPRDGRILLTRRNGYDLRGSIMDALILEGEAEEDNFAGDLVELELEECDYLESRDDDS